jgi:hypothetical protein
LWKVVDGPNPICPTDSKLLLRRVNEPFLKLKLPSLNASEPYDPITFPALSVAAEPRYFQVDEELG